MQIEYQRDLKDHYLVLHGTRQLAADAYQIHMIQENSLRGFNVCHTELVDDEIRYAYRITSMQSLEETMDMKPAGISFLRELLRSLADALEELERYLLKQDGVLLHPSFIFTDALQQRFLFCYYPENEKEISEGMKELSEFLLPHLDERDRQAVMLGFSFYQSCAAGEITEIRLKELIYEKGEPSVDNLTENGRLGGFSGQGKQAEITVPSQYQSGQDEMSNEEIRAKILDDFFSDEEEAEMERRQQAHRRLLWFLLATVCALGTAAAFALTGWVQTGIGSGVLIEALAILLWRKRRTLFAVRAAIAQRIRHRRTGEAEQYENIDSFWNTYEERAEALEASGAYSLPTHSTYSDGASKTGAVAANLPAGDTWLPVHNERTPDYHYPGVRRDIPSMWAESEQEELLPSSGYEETIWLGESETGYPKMQIWLERTESEDTGTETAGRKKQEGGSSRIPLTEKEYLIGKNAEVCDIAAASAAVSRMHARFTRGEQGYAVTDLRSRNGTFINGAMLEAGQPCELHDGDIARFGDIAYRYCCVN